MGFRAFYSNLSTGLRELLRNCLTSCTASSLHRPPISIARTTNLHFLDWATDLLVLLQHDSVTISGVRTGFPFCAQHPRKVMPTACTQNRASLVRDFDSSLVVGCHLDVHLEDVLSDNCANLAENASHHPPWGVLPLHGGGRNCPAWQPSHLH